jgi:hypothetical protein
MTCFHLPGQLQKSLDEMLELTCQMEFKGKNDQVWAGRAQSLGKAADNLQNFLQTFRPWLVEAEAVTDDDFKPEMSEDLGTRMEAALAHHDGAKTTLRRVKNLLAGN